MAGGFPLDGVAENESAYPPNNVPRGNLAWSEAKAFCEQRGMRLPTEPEWEYAARGPSNWIFPWGNEFEPDNVVYGENSPRYRYPDSNFTAPGPAPVGSRRGGASWVGALDMSGNIYEWIDGDPDDRYPDDSGPVTDIDNSVFYPIRGGSAGGIGGDHYRLRSADRESKTKSGNEHIGVRCIIHDE